jgi:hypothetical protein
MEHLVGAQRHAAVSTKSNGPRGALESCPWTELFIWQAAPGRCVTAPWVRIAARWATISTLFRLCQRYAGNTLFIHCFDAGSNFFVPRSFDLAAFSWLIQIEQQSHERQPLVSRQLDDFFGYLFDARGHMNILRSFNRKSAPICKSLILLVVREGLEPSTSAL